MSFRWVLLGVVVLLVVTAVVGGGWEGYGDYIKECKEKPSWLYTNYKRTENETKATFVEKTRQAITNHKDKTKKTPNCNQLYAYVSHKTPIRIGSGEWVTKLDALLEDAFERYTTVKLGVCPPGYSYNGSSGKCQRNGESDAVVNMADSNDHDDQDDRRDDTSTTTADTPPEPSLSEPSPFAGVDSITSDATGTNFVFNGDVGDEYTLAKCQVEGGENAMYCKDSHKCLDLRTLPVLQELLGTDNAPLTMEEVVDRVQTRCGNDTKR